MNLTSKVKIHKRVLFFLKSSRQKDVRKRQWLWAILLFLLALTLLTVNFGRQNVNLEVGQVSPVTIKAPTYIEVVDTEKTQKLRQEAAGKVSKAYDLDVTVLGQIIGATEAKFAKIQEIKNDSNLSHEQKLMDLQGLLNAGQASNLSQAELDSVLNTSDAKLTELKNVSEDLFSPIWQTGVKEEDLDSGKKIIARQLELQGFKPYQQKLVQAVLFPNLKPNLIYNKSLTEMRISEAEKSVPEVKKRISKDQVIVSQGERVTNQQIIELEALGLKQAPIDYSNLFGLALLLLIIMGGIGVYLYLYKKDIINNDRYILLLGIIILVILLLGRAIYSFVAASYYAGYLIPVAAGSLLIAILLDKKLAILVTAVLSIMIGVITNYQFNFMVLAVVSGVASVYSVSRLNHRGDLIRVGAVTSGVSFLVVFALGLMVAYPIISVIKASLLGALNGVASTILAGGILPFLEAPFGILTEPKLLELSNPNHPLLKKLLVEAPGTYHHSIIVGNLAEAATQVVGGSPLLARVGAYYHDIGKTKRPYFFIENQLSHDNPHDKLSPSLSTLIIISHTKDGAEMAKKYRLPDEIIDIIRQHHGQSLLSYFYHRALESEKNEKVLESDFRYPGPKPQTKEAAIVMLADSVEAALRAMGKPTQGVAENIVRKIVRDKLNDGQLDESALTLRDLEKIADAFLKVLAGIFHSRIEYPDDNELRELERRKNNGRSGN